MEIWRREAFSVDRKINVKTLKKGDVWHVQLKAKSLSIGTLGLPIKEVLKFAKRSYKLPKWVEINPDDQTVLLRLDQFRMQNGLFIRAEKINLVDDDIRMNIYLPKDTSSKED